MAERIPDIAADRRRSNEIETRSNDGVTLGGGEGGRNGLGMSSNVVCVYLYLIKFGDYH